MELAQAQSQIRSHGLVAKVRSRAGTSKHRDICPERLQGSQEVTGIFRTRLLATGSADDGAFCDSIYHKMITQLATSPAQTVAAAPHGNSDHSFKKVHDCDIRMLVLRLHPSSRATDARARYSTVFGRRTCLRSLQAPKRLQKMQQ